MAHITPIGMPIRVLKTTDQKASDGGGNPGCQLRETELFVRRSTPGPNGPRPEHTGRAGQDSRQAPSALKASMAPGLPLVPAQFVPGPRA